MGPLILLMACTGADDCNGIWFGDADGDGFGGDTVVVTGCDPGEGFHAQALDCDDLDPTIHPDADELCNGLDDDCDGAIDDDTAPDDGTAWFVDEDGDGFGAGDAVTACLPPDGHAAVDGDCDDTDAAARPDTPWYADRDQDGYGDSGSAVTSCQPVDGHVADDADCDDLDDEVNPDAQEVCDFRDNDCDGAVDDDDDSLDTSTYLDWYADADGDGYGDADQVVVQCGAPDDHVLVDGDCDDADDAVSPDAVEVCDDGIDNDCSGDAPECGWTGDVDPDERAIAFQGSAQYDYMGDEVVLGDFDGDGHDDVVLGEYYSSLVEATGGAAHVFYGPTTGGSEADHVLGGSGAQDYLGGGLTAGDFDGDGLDDLVAGAHGDDDGGTYSGAAFIQYGAASGWGALAETADLAGVYGADSDYLGYCVRSLGDVDGDGLADLAIGAHNEDTGATNGGSVYLLLGGPRWTGSQPIEGVFDAQVSGASNYAYLGYRDGIAALGDLDGDGLDDAALGAYGANGSEGIVYLAYGGAWAADASDLDASFWGTSDVGDAGADAADLDGDGYLDLVLPQWSEAGGGAVHVHLGAASRWSGVTVVDASDLELTHETSGDGFGYATATPDLDGDGHADLFVGAPYVDNGGHTNTGALYGYAGPLTAGTHDASTATVRIAGDDYAYLGFLDALAVGDVDDDGIDDLLAGARYANGYKGGGWLFLGEGQ